jgi:hypothetical protein
MTTSTLWGNTIGPYSTSTPTQFQSVATNFEVDAAGWITKIGWYKANSNAYTRPGRLALYGYTSGTLIRELFEVMDGSSVGWYWTILPLPLPVADGDKFKIVMDWPHSATYAHLATGSLATPDTGLSWNNPVRCILANAWGLPTSCDNTNALAIDVEWDSEEPPPNGGHLIPTNFDIENALTRWFDSGNDNTRQQELPWLTRLAVDANTILLDSLTTIAEGLETYQNTMGPVPGLYAGVLHQTTLDFIASTEAVLSVLQQRTLGTSAGGGSSFFGPGGTQVAEGVEAVKVSLENGLYQQMLREWRDLSPDLADTSRWTAGTPVHGEGDGLVDQQADLYLLTLTALPERQPIHDVAGAMWVPRWGWVAPRVHGCYRERQFPEWTVNAITAGGLYMDGLVVYAHPSTEWTVTPWTIDRS